MAQWESRKVLVGNPLGRGSMPDVLCTVRDEGVIEDKLSRTLTDLHYWRDA